MDMRRLGLLRDPFRELPGAAQPFFINDRFQRAYRDLLAAARTHAALLLLTGEAGVGKSTLLRYLCQTTYLLRGLPFGITVEICPPVQAQPNTQAEKRAEAFAANGAPKTRYVSGESCRHLGTVPDGDLTSRHRHATHPSFSG